MPLERHLVDVPLADGLQQKSDKRSVEQTGAISMTNCVRQKTGAIRKRFGAYGLPNTIPQLGGDTVRKAVRGQSYQGAALLLDGQAIYEYSDEESAFELADVLPEAVALDRITVAGNIQPLQGYDVATAPGSPVCIVWTAQTFTGGSSATGTAVYTTVLDATTGAVLQPPTIVDDSGYAMLSRVILCGSTYVLAWLGGSSHTTLYLSSLSASAISSGWSSPTNYATILNAGQGNGFDLAVVGGDATRFLLAYGKTASGNNVHLDVVTTSTLAQANTFGPTGGDTSTSFMNFACCGTSGGEFWISYLTISPSIHFMGYGVADVGHAQTSLVDFFFGSALSYYVGGQLAIIPTSATTCLVFLSYTTASGAPLHDGVNERYFLNTELFTLNTSSSHGGQGTVAGMVMASKPAFITPGLTSKLYAVMYYPSNLQGTHALVCFEQPTQAPQPQRLVSVVAPRLSSGLVSYLNQGPTVDQAGPWSLPNLLQLPAMAYRSGQGSPSTWGSLVEIDTTTLNASLALQPWDFGSELLYTGDTLGGRELGLSAGAPCSFDGSSVSEMGFLYYPEVISAASNTTGGQMPVGAAYTYIPVYEWVDAAGNVQRSGSGVPLTAPAVAYLGSSASIPGNSTITGLTGMTSAMNGTMCVLIAGAATNSNNVPNPITMVTSSTAADVWYEGTDDANNGYLSWSLLQGSIGAYITLETDGTVHVTRLTGMTSAMIGESLTTVGTKLAVNNGSFTITKVVSATEVVIDNPAGQTDPINGGSGAVWYLASSGNSGSVTITVQPLGVTYRQRLGGASSAIVNTTAVAPPTLSPVQIVFYRNTGAFIEGTWVPGTVYYRCTNATAGQGALANLCGAEYLTWTDGLSDAQIATNPILYTQGGVLDNLIPPSSRICIEHTTRWIVGGCDDPTTIWASKAYTSGEVPGFNEALTIQCSGPVRALASLDDKLIVFVQRGASYGIEYMTGLGPFDTGAQSDWTVPPQPIPSDVGAVDQRSIVVGPFGCLFKSNVGGPTGSGGIFLLTRDLQVQYMSGPVEDWLATYPIVTGAVLHPNAGRVYFECAPSDFSVSSGIRLVWNYILQSWSQDTHYDFDASNPGGGARCTWTAYGIQNVPGIGAQTGTIPMVHWAVPTGRVYRETIGLGNFAYADVDAAGATPTWVPSSYSGAWIKPTMSGFSRFWRVQLQADALDPSASLAVVLNFDYAPSTYYFEESTWTAAQMAAFDRAPQVDLQMVPRNQKAKAIQVVLQDYGTLSAANPVTAQGMSWASLSLELGVSDRAYTNLPARQKA